MAIMLYLSKMPAQLENACLSWKMLFSDGRISQIWLPVDSTSTHVHTSAKQDMYL